MTAQLLAADDPHAIELAIQALMRGQLVAIPTETVYGVCALPTDEAVERLIQAKRRATDKGIQLLIDTLEQARSVAVVTPAAERLAERFWPGGLTIVLDRRQASDLTPLLSGGRPTLGLRLPDHDVPRALARRLGPIAASSANVSGEPDATNASLVARSLGDALALILDGGAVRGGTPSTVVDCSSGTGEPRVLREGAIAAAAIATALRQE
jgi:L-threonylcarbamoyladenylate synthase